MKEKFFPCLIGAVLILAIASSAQGGRWRLLGESDDLQAFAPKDAGCGSEYQIIIRAPHAAVFADKNKIRNFFDDLNTLLGTECPQLKSVMLSGRVQRKEVYRSKASETGNWTLVDIVTPPDTFKECRGADPTIFEDVFKCMASAKYPNKDTNIFVNNLGTRDCQSISMTYLKHFTDHGYSREEAKERLPGCEIFALAAREMTGQSLSWESCTGYGKKDARIHLDDCLSASKNKLKRIAGCEQIRQEYEKALKNADHERNLPQDYTPPDCGDANALIAKWTGKDPDAHPCAGFDPGDIAGHISKCFSSSSAAVSLMNVENCQDARRVYEEKLREAYGGLPPGYVMAGCTELEPVQAMAKDYRKEMAEKAAAEELEKIRKIKESQEAAEKERQRAEYADTKRKFREAAKEAGENPDVHPCAEYNPEDIAGHIVKCFDHPVTKTSLEKVKDCRGGVVVYEWKLREAYDGELPPEYKSPVCSDFETMLAMAEEYRKEAAIKAEEAAVKKRESYIIGIKAPENIDECDRLAAHPGDSQKPAYVAGVVDEQVDIEPALNACIKSFETNPENSRLAFQLGRTLFLGGAYEDAADFLNAASESGHLAAKFYLADLYASGQGVEENAEIAQSLYDESEKGGFLPDAQPKEPQATTVDLAQFGMPDFLQAVYEGNTKPYTERPLGSISYIMNLNSALGENTYLASDQAALLRVYDPTLNQVLERKTLTSPVAQGQMMEGAGQVLTNFLRGYESAANAKDMATGMSKIYGELYKGADGPGLTLAEIKELGARDGKLFVFLFNDNPDVFVKLYNGIKRFVHEEL